MRKTAAEGNVQAVVARPADGLFIVDPAKDRQSCGRKGRGERASSTQGNQSGIDIYRFSLVDSELVDIVHLNGTYRAKSQGVSGIPLLRVWVTVVGVHKPAHGSICQLRGRRRICGHWIHAELPLAERNVCSGDRAATASLPRAIADDRECGVEDRRVGLLEHEQRNIFEGLTEVEAVPGAKDVLALSSEVISKTDSRAEVFVVILRE